MRLALLFARQMPILTVSCIHRLGGDAYGCASARSLTKCVRVAHWLFFNLPLRYLRRASASRTRARRLIVGCHSPKLEQSDFRILWARGFMKQIIKILGYAARIKVGWNGNVRRAPLAIRSGEVSYPLPIPPFYIDSASENFEPQSIRSHSEIATSALIRTDLVSSPPNVGDKLRGKVARPLLFSLQGEGHF